MPVTTRAGAKRALGDADSTNANGLQVQPSKRAKVSKKGSSQRASTKASARSRTKLLSLPSEIRNQIYYFATEDSYFGSWSDPAPLLLHRWNIGNPRTKRTVGTNSHQFFGLTQVCKQIRAEYRPLWLRSSSVRLKFSCLRRFLDTFYPTISDYQNAPKLLQISWEHWDDCEDDQLVDLHRLLQLRAHCITFKAEFVSHELSHYHGPICDQCGERHDEVDDEAYTDWIDEQLEEYGYLTSLNDFLAYENETWLGDIIEGKIRVSCAFDELREYMTIFIRFSKEAARKSLNSGSIAGAGMRYLKRTMLREQSFYRRKWMGKKVMQFEITVAMY